MYKPASTRAISPIVATSLLLIVAVLSITGFQTWYTGYQSSTLANVEEQSQTSSILNVEGIVGDILYLKSGSEVALDILKISDSNGNTMCDLTSLEEYSNPNLISYWDFESECSNSTFVCDKVCINII